MNISQSYDVNFVFLGSRSYVHATSMTHGLFEAVKTWSLGTIHRLQLDVRSLLKEQGRYDLFRDVREKHHVEKQYNAMYRLQCGGDLFWVGLRGRGEPVSVSEPYDENKLIADGKILTDSKSATFMLKPEALIVNIIIALNKKLVNALFPTAGYGQWFLARYDLDWDKACPAEPALLEIEVAGNIGASNTKSGIRLDGEPIGLIFFSRNVK